MAAAIKMDELLVSWLGSDNVYDGVKKLIESHKQNQDSANSSNKVTPPTSPLPPSSSPSSPPQPPEKKQERRGIPPFYHHRELNRSSDDDKKGPLSRPRRCNMDDDTSWDGTATIKPPKNTLNTETVTNDGKSFHKNNNNIGNIPPPPPPPISIATNNGDDSSISTNNNAIGEQQLTISEQVKLIFEELGQKSDDTNDNSNQLFLTSDAFVKITKDICRFPTFFNGPLYKRILYLWQTQRNSDKPIDKQHYQTYMNTQQDMTQYITYDMMEWYWKLEMQKYDLSDRFFRLVKAPYRNYIIRDDFLPFIKELLNDHPGLEFLSTHAEFQEKYAVTVITRIFYTVNKCHSGRITSRQIRHSDILSAFQQVDEEEDINKVTKYFSYEHFYVLYCRFWELDHDRDYRITRDDLLKYSEHCLSHLIVDRIFDAAPRPFGGNAAAIEQVTTIKSADEDSENNEDRNNESGVNRDYLNYEDFIYFMLSEEDKANEISIRYWFSCIDVDGDGKLNNMEMRSFYMVQLHRMQCMGHEIVPFEDMLCQMIDMIKPANNDYLIVEDFLQTECAAVSGALFDALFNLNKYLQFEQRDPFQERQKREDEFETDWDRFAFIDYNRLAMEEENREEAMEIDWVAVDEDDDDGDMHNVFGGASEAPF